MTAIYYHAIDPHDNIFCNNVFVGKGIVTAISAMRGSTPAYAGFRSPYEAFTRERPKEDAFEAIRSKEYPDAPPRMGALFLFDSLSSAEQANATWWQGQRIVLQAQILFAHRFGKFDSQWLNASKDQWESAARAYWSGSMSNAPQIEALVDGMVQLIGWEPYGRRLVSKGVHP